MSGGDGEAVRRGSVLGTCPPVDVRFSWKETTAEVVRSASLRVGRLAVGVVTVAAFASCGAASGSGTTAPTPATTTATASLPPGGPAPPPLIGDWNDLNAIPAVAPVVLTLTSSRYTLHTGDGEYSGAIVVNGDEIDFFSGTGCNDPLPGGVGRYRWTVQGVTLHLSPLNEDPCGRVSVLSNRSFTRGT